MASFYTAGVVGGSTSGIRIGGGDPGSLRFQFPAIDAPAEEELQAGEMSVSLNLT
jgi:hypothetical protein